MRQAYSCWGELAVHRAGLRKFQDPRQERVTLHEILSNLERDFEVRGRKSLPQLKSHLKHVRAFFRFDRALAVTSARLRDYIAHRQQQGAASATINRETETVRRAFVIAMESDLLAVSPKIPRLPERNARQGFFEKADFEAVVARIADPDVVDFLRWFYATGMRPGEIRSLSWASFDRETWTLRPHARDTKSGHGRVLPLEGDLRGIIERRQKARRLDCPLIFHRGGKPLGEFRKTWARACREAGLAGKLVYDLRRTAVRNLVRAGVPERVAMSVSGHRSRSIFDRYDIVDERDLRDAVARTSAYVEGLPSDRTVVPLPWIKRTGE